MNQNNLNIFYLKLKIFYYSFLDIFHDYNFDFKYILKLNRRSFCSNYHISFIQYISSKTLTSLQIDDNIKKILDCRSQY